MEKKTVVVKERERISREIHDGLGGGFSNAITLVNLIERESGGQGRGERLAHLRSILNDGFTELRNLILAMEGEVASLKELAALIHEKTQKISETASLDCDINIDIGNGGQVVSQRLSLNLLRILQEGLTNIIKHARANLVDICIVFRLNIFFFELRDDGRGFEAKGQSKGYGLRNMKRRCREMGAELTLDSSPGKGTLLSLSFALDPSSEHQS